MKRRDFLKGAAGAAGMAAGEPAQRQAEPACGSMALNGFDRVFRARWQKAAARSECRAYEIPVAFQQQDQALSHCRCIRRSRRAIAP